ncbi:MAG: hypothetical protein FJZ64_01610 [Chlamydiae bacterium]|nr:hypothetical protein [Chlamydiota bacterium]
MKDHSFETLKKALSEPKLTSEQLCEFLQELRIYLQVARVKLESKNNALQKIAENEIQELRKLLETNLLLKKYSSILK